jgi:hypothetical protein
MLVCDVHNGLGKYLSWVRFAVKNLGNKVDLHALLGLQRMIELRVDCLDTFEDYQDNLSLQSR